MMTAHGEHTNTHRDAKEKYKTKAREIEKGKDETHSV